MSEPTTIFVSRRIITMSPDQPFATHVAVRDGRILDVGGPAEMERWRGAALDRSFADKVLMPGFVEGHSHVMSGAVWRACYIGYFDRIGPDGRRWEGLKSITAVTARLRAAESALPDADTPLFAWGFDPIYFGNRRMVRADLDPISSVRPIVVRHSNGHIININSALLHRAGITPDTRVSGIVRDEAGQPTGELQEMAAKFMALRHVEEEFGAAADALQQYGRLAVLGGATTVTDLYNELDDETVRSYREITARDDCPVRLVPALNPARLGPEGGVQRLKELVGLSNERLRFGIVKLMTDGSIQGFTARLKWPYYYNGRGNGLWNMGPMELPGFVEAFHRAGFQIHIHVNGDEASELALDTIETSLAAAPRWDHRHTLQHCQMAPESQFRRMAALGVSVNLFANHIFYWGDAHRRETMGPWRANRMDAVGTAHRLGVPYAIHSDSPVTPLGPLFTAWCAVNRRTAEGVVLGEQERIPVADALRAITLGAAWTLKLDHEIGSIECGKRADFAVLEDDPLLAAPEALKDTRVWGTVLGGRIFPAGAAL
ncbi:MAG: amidohydrolase [Acetobacteraceae bacterium]